MFGQPEPRFCQVKERDHDFNTQVVETVLNHAEEVDMKGLFLEFLLVLVCTAVLISQQSVVYVDSYRGDDLIGDGKNQAGDPAGPGPLKTITRALFKVGDRGTIIVSAGTYQYDGEIMIDASSAPHVKTQLTLIAQKMGANTCVEIGADSVMINIDNLELNIETAGGTEYFSLDGKLILGSKKNNVKVNLSKSSFLRVKSEKSLVVNGKSEFTDAKPEIGKQ
jgi:hypothetical protein